MTALDDAFLAMSAVQDDYNLRLAFYGVLAAAELTLLLAEEAAGDEANPDIFETADGNFALVFDTEERLGAFVGGPAPYAAMPGRQIVRALAGQSIGLGLNLGVAPSSWLIPAEAVDWLAETLSGRPSEATERPIEIWAPGDLPERLLPALDARLAAMAGSASAACLVGVTWESGGSGHLLALIDAAHGAERALAEAVGEALVFSGLEAAALDVAFVQGDDPISDKLRRIGLRFDLPEAPSVTLSRDETRPPTLR